MKKNALALVILLTVCSFVGFAQQRLDFSGASETDKTSFYFSKYIAEEKYTDIAGSPYLYDAWDTCIIKLNSGIELVIDACRYDVYEDKLIFMKDDKPLYFSNPQDISSFKLGSSLFVNLDNDKSEKFYEKVLEGENFLLLKDYRCSYMQAKESTGAFPATPDTYTVKFEYYIQKNSNLPEKIKLKEKSIVSLFPEKEQEIKAFIYEQNIDCKNENDVIRIFEYYASL